MAPLRTCSRHLGATVAVRALALLGARHAPCAFQGMGNHPPAPVSRASSLCTCSSLSLPHSPPGNSSCLGTWTELLVKFSLLCFLPAHLSDFLSHVCLCLLIHEMQGHLQWVSEDMVPLEPLTPATYHCCWCQKLLVSHHTKERAPCQLSSPGFNCSPFCYLHQTTTFLGNYLDSPSPCKQKREPPSYSM